MTWVLPIALLFAVWYLIMRRIGGGASQALQFGRSRAKVYNRQELRTTFADVAGVDEAVAELREIVDFLKQPQKYQRLGGRPPKGALLVGPPGSGKTLLARAVAGEADVPFFYISGSEFVEMFVGVGASRVRELFEEAKKHAPCIIFIDELDTIGKSRSAAITFGGHDEREQTLNQLLAEMDGFDPRTGVIIMAATNRPEVLDQALLRPGRFDRMVVVDRPDLNGRVAILAVHARKVKLAGRHRPARDRRADARRRGGGAREHHQRGGAPGCATRRRLGETARPAGSDRTRDGRPGAEVTRPVGEGEGPRRVSRDGSRARRPSSSSTPTPYTRSRSSRAAQLRSG